VRADDEILAGDFRHRRDKRLDVGILHVQRMRAGLIRNRRVRYGRCRGGRLGLRTGQDGGKGEYGGNEESRHCIFLYEYISAQCRLTVSVAGLPLRSTVTDKLPAPARLSMNCCGLDTADNDWPLIAVIRSVDLSPAWLIRRATSPPPDRRAPAILPFSNTGST